MYSRLLGILVALFPVSHHLLWSGEPRTGCVFPGGTSHTPAEEESSFPWAADSVSPDDDHSSKIRIRKHLHCSGKFNSTSSTLPRIWYPHGQGLPGAAGQGLADRSRTAGGHWGSTSPGCRAPLWGLGWAKAGPGFWPMSSGWDQVHWGKGSQTHPWDGWAGPWGPSWAETRLEMPVSLKVELLAPTVQGLTLLLMDQLCHSQAGLEPWAPGAQNPASTCLGNGHSSSSAFFCLQRRSCFLFTSVKLVSGRLWCCLRPPGTAAVQIIAWNLFWVRYFLSVSKGFN